MYAEVVISPATTATPVVSRVSQATRDPASWSSISSRIASDTWSATLSGWPSVTDSDVKTWRLELDIGRQDSGSGIGGGTLAQASAAPLTRQRVPEAQQ